MSLLSRVGERILYIDLDFMYEAESSITNRMRYIHRESEELGYSILNILLFKNKKEYRRLCDHVNHIIEILQYYYQETDNEFKESEEYVYGLISRLWSVDVNMYKRCIERPEVSYLVLASRCSLSKVLLPKTYLYNNLEECRRVLLNILKYIANVIVTGKSIDIKNELDQYLWIEYERI